MRASDRDATVIYMGKDMKTNPVIFSDSSLRTSY